MRGLLNLFGIDLRNKLPDIYKPPLDAGKRDGMRADLECCKVKYQVETWNYSEV